MRAHREHRPVMLAFLLLAVSAACRIAPPVAITVWLPGFDLQREAMARDFVAEYPETRLNLVCQPSDKYWQRLFTAVAGATCPDLCLADFNLAATLAESGACQPLDPFLADLRDLSAFEPALMRLLTTGGKVQGLPVTGHPLALFIRQDWLAKLGLKPPTTWEELYRVAEAFTRKDPDGNSQADTFGLAERWPPVDPDVATRFLPWLYQAGGTVVSCQDGKWAPAFGMAAGVKALRFRRRLWEAGCIPPGAPVNDAAQNLALFLKGQAGMIVEDDRCVPAVRQALGALAASIPLPRDLKRATVGDGLCFVLLARSNRKSAAFDFVQWWLSKKVQERLILGWSDKPGAESGALVLGPRRDLDPAALRAEPLYTGFVKSFPYHCLEPSCPRYHQLQQAIARAAAAAMTPEKTVEEALAAGMAEADGLLR